MKESIQPRVGNNQQSNELTERIVTIYCLIDDLVRCVFNKNSIGRPATLTLTECCLVSILRQYWGCKDWKHTYKIIVQYHSREFRGIGSYKSFVSCMNRNGIFMQVINQILMIIAQRISRGVWIVDGSKIPVCSNHRIRSNKVMKEISSLMKGSMGYWYGLKLNLCVSESGDILLFSFTTANASERKFLKTVIEEIRGLFVADAGYISKELEKLAASFGSLLLTCSKKNMKKIATYWQIEYLKRRIKVESVLSVLKDRMGLVTSLPRSVLGFFSHFQYVIFAYQFNKLFNSFVS